MHPIQLLMKSQMIGGLNLLRIAEKNPLIIQNCMKPGVNLTIEGILKPHVGATYSASRLAEAHQALEERGTIGKVEIQW
jgi:NADPH:quinone reductase-like Zn-dependent oxidoreductase